jgi:hypothetical protein
MKQLLCLSLVLFKVSLSCFAQEQNASSAYKAKFGLIGGLNFFSINAIKSADLATRNSTGFFAGGYYALPAKRVGYRSEILFSRQGYNYKTASQTGGVMLDYLVLPQLTTLNITRFFQLYAGAQIAFLLNTKVDSLPGASSVPGPEHANEYFAKTNYGFTGGLEIKPLAGLLVGGRYNLFFNLLHDANATAPSYVPKYDGNLKNGLVQLYVGYQF